MGIRKGEGPQEYDKTERGWPREEGRTYEEAKGGVQEDLRWGNTEDVGGGLGIKVRGPQ